MALRFVKLEDAPNSVYEIVTLRYEQLGTVRRIPDRYVAGQRFRWQVEPTELGKALAASGIRGRLDLPTRQDALVWLRPRTEAEEATRWQQ